MRRKSKYSLDYQTSGYNLLEKYSDKKGYRVFILESSKTKTLIFDIIKINYLKRKVDFNRWQEIEIFCLKEKSKEGYFIDPSTFNYNISFLNKISHRVRNWILKRLNSLPVGNNGKTIGDFCVRSKCGYLSYDLGALNKEINI